jgi:hypothetical protein
MKFISSGLNERTFRECALANLVPAFVEVSVGDDTVKVASAATFFDFSHPGMKIYFSLNEGEA